MNFVLRLLNCVKNRVVSVRYFLSGIDCCKYLADNFVLLHLVCWWYSTYLSYYAISVSVTGALMQWLYNEGTLFDLFLDWYAHICEKNSDILLVFWKFSLPFFFLFSSISWYSISRLPFFYLLISAIWGLFFDCLFLLCGIIKSDGWN